MTATVALSSGSCYSDGFVPDPIFLNRAAAARGQAFQSLVGLVPGSRLTAMEAFEHESLDPYATAVEFTLLVDKLTMVMPPTRAYLAEAMRQAAREMISEIAVGASEPEYHGQHRFLSAARRAAVRCAALLDLFRQLGLIAAEQREAGRDLLLRTVDGLTRLEHALAAETSRTMEEKEDRA
jgi:hypothetical protein